MVSHITCHHCWYHFPLHDIVWIARHEELAGDTVAGDEAYIRFRASRFNAEGEALDARGLPCQELACPRCHFLIPRLMIEDQPLLISIIGGPSSGKSNLLAAMTWELRRVLLEKFAVAFNDADAISNQIVNGYENTLFQQSDGDQFVVLQKTELEGELYQSVTIGDQPVLLPRPALFTMRPTREHVQSTGRTQHGRVLCLYDNAGEHFLPGYDSTVAPGTQHVARSRLLMFVYDPTQAPRFQKECLRVSNDPQLSGGASAVVRQDTILTEAVSRTRKYAHIGPNQRLQQPLIVLVSKSDVWGTLLEDEDITAEPFLEMTSSSGGTTRIDFAKVQRVSVKVRDLLKRLTPEFVAAAEDACQIVVYIPVSALGRSPEPMNDNARALGIRSRDIHPRWVTVPMLYALGKWSSGIIPKA